MQEDWLKYFINVKEWLLKIILISQFDKTESNQKLIQKYNLSTSGEGQHVIEDI